MNILWNVVLAAGIIIWGLARVAGRLPRWFAPRSIPRWFGGVEVVLGMCVLVFALGADWILNFLWVFAAIVVALVLVDQVLRALRGVRRWRKRQESEDERLRAVLKEGPGV
jgi:hypothetical protein